MAQVGPALQRFSSTLRALYEAAGKPIQSTVFSKTGVPDSTLSGWMHTVNAPSKATTERFFVLIEYLDAEAVNQEKKQQKGPSPARLPRPVWEGLLRAVQAERSGKGGRPPRASGVVTRSSARLAANAAGPVERDRALREQDAWVKEHVLPDVLIDREEEFAELRAFCAPLDAEVRSPYAWWQAAPWAGKTALLAEFVVRGAPQQIEVVSHFIYSYPALLDRAGDLERLARLVLDPLRQLELLRRSSADAALAQLELTRRRITRSASEVDLGTLAALGASRDMLSEGADALPPSLAEALARLGHVPRALQVARAAASPADRARRLAALAGVLAESDQESAVYAAQEAATLALQARSEADSGDEYDAEVAAGEAAVALISASRDQDELDLLATLSPPPWSGDDTLPCVMRSKASLAIRTRSADLAEDLLDQAERSIEQIDHPADPASPITAWAAIAAAASPARAAAMYARIGEHATSELPPLLSGYVRATAASVLADARREEAAQLARQAAQLIEETLASSEPSTGERPDLFELEIALTSSTQALIDTGQTEHARSLIASVPPTVRSGLGGNDIRSKALAALNGPQTTSAETAAQQAVEMARQGRTEEAERRLQEAIDAPPASSLNPREAQLDVLAWALAAVSRLADAELLAVSLGDLPQGVRALAGIAIEAAAAGHLPEARRLAHEAADRSRRLEGAGNFSPFAGAPGHQVAAAQAAAAEALACAGERDAALALAYDLTQTSYSAGSRALIGVAAGLRLHDAASSVKLVDRALERLVSDATQGTGVICKLAELLTAIANADQACAARIEQTIDQRTSAQELAALELEELLVICLLKARSEREPAMELLAKLERSAASAPPGHFEPGAFAIARAVFEDFDGARRAALDHHNPIARASGFAAVADYLTWTAPGFRPLWHSPRIILVHVLHSLALLIAPPSTDATAEYAASFVRAALEDDGWFHALPALARIAPEAVERINDIVFIHRGLTRLDDIAAPDAGA